LSNLESNYQQVLNRINKLAKHQVLLLAVSKTKPIEQIQALAKLGQQDFGENYLQESLNKIAICPELTWHFIGPIQSNKTKLIAENFSWVHSVDRLKVANRLSNQRPEQLPSLNVLLEVNISGETSKAGLMPNEVVEMAKQVNQLPNLTLRGLMAIPIKANSYEEQRKPFKAMSELLKLCQQAIPDNQLDTLSMGMSADLEAAIEEGATIVRVGSDIFGARETKK
jgi:pyridoxal phosphate enzyme (YggS family)